MPGYLVLEEDAKIEDFMAGGLRSKSPERRRRKRVDLAGERVCFRLVSQAVMEMDARAIAEGGCDAEQVGKRCWLLVQLPKGYAEQVGRKAANGLYGLLDKLVLVIAVDSAVWWVRY